MNFDQWFKNYMQRPDAPFVVSRDTEAMLELAYDAGACNGYDEGYEEGCMDTNGKVINILDDMLDDNVIALCKELGEARYINEQVDAWRALIGYFYQGVNGNDS